MMTIKEEWNKKLQTTQIECERQLAELQAKHALNISTLQQDYQELMNEKLSINLSNSIIRIAFAKDLGNEGRRVCKDMLIDACNQAQGVYSKIFGMF
jgi:hypothetical protein